MLHDFGVGYSAAAGCVVAATGRCLIMAVLPWTSAKCMKRHGSLNPLYRLL
jgi:methionyl-tRNA formyltransferase